MKKIFTSLLIAGLLTFSLVSASTLTLRPDGAGANKQWGNVGCSSGNGEWQCVDEVTLNTADYLRTGGTKKETFTFGNTGLSSETVNNVTIYYEAMRHNKNANRCFEAMTRSAGVNYFAGTQICTTSSWATYSHVYTTNPATGSAWTVSEVDALEAGMRGLNPDNGGRVAQVWVVVDYTVGAVCGNNVTEGAEVCDGTDLNSQTCSSQGFDGGSLSCAIDCTGYVTTSCWDNSCSDTDGGNNPFTAGTTSGNLSGSPYSNNDVCFDASSVTEYFCSAELENNSVVSCGTDTSDDVCNGGDVWTNATDYSCGSGACSSNNTFTLTESCSNGCAAGACYICGNNVTEGTETCDGTDLGNTTCVSLGYDGGVLGCSGTCGGYDTSGCYFNTCNDSDGYNITNAGWVNGTSGGSPFTNFDFCATNVTVTEWQCGGATPVAINFSCLNGTTACSSGACV